MKITGTVKNNAGSFSERIAAYKTAFVEATKITNLHEGSLNVWVGEHVAIWPEFMIGGDKVGKPNEDCLFESCKIIVGSTEYAGFRVRPYHRPDGKGGNGDNCLEILAETIPEVPQGTTVTLEFARCSRLQVPNRT